MRSDHLTNLQHWPLILPAASSGQWWKRSPCSAMLANNTSHLLLIFHEHIITSIKYKVVVLTVSSPQQHPHMLAYFCTASLQNTSTATHQCLGCNNTQTPPLSCCTETSHSSTKCLSRGSSRTSTTNRKEVVSMHPSNSSSSQGGEILPGISMFLSVPLLGTVCWLGVSRKEAYVGWVADSRPGQAVCV